jgi:hypothetical protein
MEEQSFTDLTMLVGLRRILRFVEAKESKYRIASEMLAVGLMLPQESKAAFITTVARFYQDDSDPESFPEWRKFRGKLQSYLLKAQALAQQVDMLLQDQEVREVSLKQLELFASAQGRNGVDMTTGEVIQEAEEG